MFKALYTATSSFWSAASPAEQTSPAAEKPINKISLPLTTIFPVTNDTSTPTPGDTDTPNDTLLGASIFNDYCPVPPVEISNIRERVSSVEESDSESDSSVSSFDEGAINEAPIDTTMQQQEDDDNYGFHMVAGQEKPGVPELVARKKIYSDPDVGDFVLVTDPDKSMPDKVPSGMPSKNRHCSRYTSFFHYNATKTTIEPTKSAHKVEVAQKKKVIKDEVELTKIVYNKLVIKSKELMAPLEAAANEFFKFLAPDSVSRSYAVCDNSGKYASIVSNAIKGYESFAQRPLTEADLEDEKSIKRLAEIIVGSYIFGEDDLHRGNAGLTARIDFDMLFWKLFYRVKGYRLGVDGITRDPRTAFNYDADDIRSLPTLKKNGCFYAPGKTGLTSNAFSQEEVAVFAKLTNNPIFIYHKFRLMLKFILSTNDIISRQLAQLHIPSDATVVVDGEAKNAIKLLAETNCQNRKELYDVLIDMPEFHDFIKNDGEKALKEIKEELTHHNEKIKAKLGKGKNYYQDSLVDMKNIEQKYEALLSDIDKRKIKSFGLDDDNNPMMESISIAGFRL
jgi:hypothetical protein